MRTLRMGVWGEMGVCFIPTRQTVSSPRRRTHPSAQASARDSLQIAAETDPQNPPNPHVAEPQARSAMSDPLHPRVSAGRQEFSPTGVGDATKQDQEHRSGERHQHRIAGKQMAADCADHDHRKKARA